MGSGWRLGNGLTLSSFVSWETVCSVLHQECFTHTHDLHDGCILTLKSNPRDTVAVHFDTVVAERYKLLAKLLYVFVFIAFFFKRVFHFFAN